MSNLNNGRRTDDDAEGIPDGDDGTRRKCKNSFLCCFARCNRGNEVEPCPANCEESEIVIRSNNAEEYKFQARLKTTEVQEDKETYRRHVFTDVEKGGAADQISIKDGDELVSINEEVFAPGRTHEHVMKLLSNIKIDGNSENLMITDRKQKLNEATFYIALEPMSPRPGIVVPMSQRPGIVEPMSQRQVQRRLQIIKKPEIIENRDEIIIDSLWKYKVHGSQQYLKITGRLVTAAVLMEDCDKSHAICRKNKYYFDKKGHVRYIVALYDYDGKRFICVDEQHGGGISVQDEADFPGSSPEWFDFQNAGGPAIFKSKHGHYLAFDHGSKQVRLLPSEYHWAETQFSCDA